MIIGEVSGGIVGRRSGKRRIIRGEEKWEKVQGVGEKVTGGEDLNYLINILI